MKKNPGTSITTADLRRGCQLVDLLPARAKQSFLGRLSGEQLLSLIADSRAYYRMVVA
jgi:hypothetical protein